MRDFAPQFDQFHTHSYADRASGFNPWLCDRTILRPYAAFRSFARLCSDFKNSDLSGSETSTSVRPA